MKQRARTRGILADKLYAAPMFCRDDLHRLRNMAGIWSMSPRDFEWFTKYLLDELGHERVRVTPKRGPYGDALAEGTHATERFLERSAALVRAGNIRQAAAFFGVPEKTLERWYYAFLKRREQSTSPEAASPIRSIGIDELALKKGTAASSR